MRSLRLLLASLLLQTLFAAHVNAERVVILPVEGTNLAPGEQQAASALLAQSYAEISGIDVHRPTLDQAQGAAISAESLRQLGASEYIRTSMVKLEAKLLIRSGRYAVDGREIHGVRLTAASLDDLEQAMNRVARALHNRESVVEARTSKNITQTEGKEPNRLFTEKIMGVKTGVVLPVAWRSETLRPVISVGFNARLEAERYFLEFGAGALIPSTGDNDAVGGAYAEIGANWYLINANVSPYIGAGITPRLMAGYGDGGGRFGFWGQVGAMFMRESSQRLYADFRVTQNVIPFTKETTDSAGDYREKRYFPTEFTLLAGVGW